MFSFNSGINSWNSWETTSDSTSTSTYPSCFTPANSVESADSVELAETVTNKKVNMLYENFVRDIIHDQTLIGKKQFNSIQDLISFADNKYINEAKLSNDKDSNLLRIAYLEKIKSIEYENKELFEHICNKETAAFSSQKDKDWYLKTKNWLLGKPLTENVYDKKTLESSSEEIKKVEKIRYSPTTLDKDRRPDFKPLPIWWKAKDAKDPDLSKKKFLVSKYPFLSEHHKEKNRGDDKNNNEE